SNFSALAPMQVRFFTNSVNGADQLRQRVVFALGQIFVISLQDLFYQGKMIPYLNMLANDSFGNFFNLMKDVTLSPAMGEYLNMVNNDNPNHDTGSKTLLNGQVLPAGQTAAKDMDDALHNVFNHSNVGPFFSKLLIQHLVMSNPSPAYVQRVAAAFNNNGSGVRGDMKAV